MGITGLNLSGLRWFYGDGSSQLADMYYGYAGGLHAMGYVSLSMLALCVARSCERKNLFKAEFWRYRLHKGMTTELWYDLSAMARFERIDQAQGRRLLEDMRNGKS